MRKEQSVMIIGDKNQLFQSVNDALSPLFKITFIESQRIRSDFTKYDINIVVVLKNTAETPAEIIQYLLGVKPNTSIIYIHDQQDFQLLREVIREGATDFLVLPDEVSLLPDRINRLKTQLATESEIASTTGSFKRGKGQVLAFYSGKGGSGKTFLSTAFAQTLKLESTAQVLFIDLNLQFGGAETFFGLEGNRTLIDLEPVIHEINEHHIRNVSEKEPHSKLEILLSPRDAELAERIDSDFIIRLLRACRRNFDFIIVDIPSTVDEFGYAVLDEADRIYYVMTLDTPAIKVLKHVEELFARLGIMTENKLEIILNETGKENELTKKDLERFIKYPILTEVKRDIKGVQAAINQGVPVRKESKEKKLIPAAKDVHKWVTSMLK